MVCGEIKCIKKSYPQCTLACTKIESRDDVIDANYHFPMHVQEVLSDIMCADFPCGQHAGSAVSASK